VVRSSDRSEVVDYVTLEQALALLEGLGGTLVRCEVGGWLLVVDDAAAWPVDPSQQAPSE
jgi:hypothetical protein